MPSPPGRCLCRDRSTDLAPAFAYFGMLMVWLSLYLDLPMGILRCARYERIPLLDTASFRGDYPRHPPYSDTPEKKSVNP